MNANVRRGFNRLYIVLTLVWAAYCLIGYPSQQQMRAFEQYTRDQKLCSAPPLGKEYASPDDIGSCLDIMEKNWQTANERWSFKTFYRWAWWLLLLAVIAFPLFVYGCCRGAAAVGLWVFKGFRQQS